MNSPQRSVQVRPVSRVAIHVALTRLASTQRQVGPRILDLARFERIVLEHVERHLSLQPADHPSKAVCELLLPFTVHDILSSGLGDVFGTSAEDYTSVRDTSGTEHRHLKRRCSLPTLLVTAHVLTTSEYQARTAKNPPENRLAVEHLAGKSHVVYELDIGVSGHRIDWNPGLANVGVFRKRQFEYTIDE